MAQKSDRATRILSEEERRQRELERRMKKRYRRIEAPKKRGPQFLPFLLSLLAITVILFRFFGPELGIDMSFLDTEDVEGLRVEDEAAADAGFERLDPAPFREPITTLETSLFTPDLADRSLQDLASDLAVGLDRLASRLRAVGRESVDSAAETLEAASASLDSSEDFDLRRLEALRERWTEVRNATFVPATWFHEPMVAVGDGESELVLAAYRDQAGRLRDLVDDALAEAVVVTDTANPDAETRARLAEEWSLFARDWRDRHAALVEERLPRPDAAGSGDMLLAVQRYEQFLRQTESLVSADRLPGPRDLRTYEAAQVDARDLLDRFDELVSK